jgi:hypothetical protein
MPVRETEDPSHEPLIVAFYDYGHMVDKNVSNMSEAQVTGRHIPAMFNFHLTQF